MPVYLVVCNWDYSDCSLLTPSWCGEGW